MPHPKHAPIGLVWTRVLRIVGDLTTATATAVAELLRPGAAPSRVEVGRVVTMLTNMMRHNYLCHAGGVWTVSEDGGFILSELANPPRRIYKTDARHRRKAARRRSALRAERLCINGRSHGPATRGCRCDACYETHKGSA